MLTATGKDGITLSSTTASQEVLNKAVGVEPSAVPAKDETSSAAAAEGKQAETVTDSEAANPTESEEVKKHKGGWQRRIDKLTKTNTTLAETLEEERLARQRLEARLAGKEPAAAAPETTANAAGDDPEPRDTEQNPKTGKPWKDWNEFNTEHTRWVLRQESKATAEKTTAEQDKQQLESTWKTHQDNLSKAAEKYDDFQDAIAAFQKEAPVSEGLALAVIELDNSADVLYHLAKNPEVLKELRGLSEFKAVAKLGVISDKLSAAASAASASAAPADQKKSAGPPAPKTVASSAPEPITPVGGGSAATTVDRSKISTTDWIKQRNAGQIK